MEAAKMDGDRGKENKELWEVGGKGRIAEYMVDGGSESIPRWARKYVTGIREIVLGLPVHDL